MENQVPKKEWLAKLKKIKNNTTPLSFSAQKPVAHWILWLTLFSVIVFLIWAKFAVLEEVTVASGTVIPLTPIQSIQNMEGGIIKSIPVHENEIVEKGQVLVYLDPVRFNSTLNEATAKQTILNFKIARLTAEMENKPFTVDPQLESQYPSLYQNEKNLYNSRKGQIEEMQKNYDLAMHELNMTKGMVKDGATAEVDVLHLERQAIAIKTQLDDFRSRALDELDTAKTDLASVMANKTAIDDRIARATIYSPVRGFVKEIRTPTYEGVVMPGTEIMSILPLEDALLVEAEVKPSQIGFIHLDSPAEVKITAYDATKYGDLEGKVKDISADTIKDKEGKVFYRVRIKTDKNYLIDPDTNKPLYVIPGMTATVDIKSGKKSVLDYILTPLARARANALRER